MCVHHAGMYDWSATCTAMPPEHTAAVCCNVATQDCTEAFCVTPDPVMKQSQASSKHDMTNISCKDA